MLIAYKGYNERDASIAPAILVRCGGRLHLIFTMLITLIPTPQHIDINSTDLVLYLLLRLFSQLHYFTEIRITATFDLQFLRIACSVSNKSHPKSHILLHVQTIL
uniref:Uncharacterized protein n=1 Tax=Ciona savignyi TaxID=51511 RepID=H2ZEQ8_CIOSA